MPQRSQASNLNNPSVILWDTDFQKRKRNPSGARLATPTTLLYQPDIQIQFFLGPHAVL